MDASLAPGTRGHLRILTCGSVDDGKSTLIGRLLHDTGSVKDDVLARLAADSRRFGTTGGEIDLALLVDGLEAERQAGITIDVAHIFFSTPRRSFVVADTPGHEQYTRNMVTGASHSDLAILLVDSRKGLLTQTHRHALVCSLLGIRHVVLAVNKIDLVGFDEAPFAEIAAQFERFAAALGFRSVRAMPVSARLGDNVVDLSARTPWYRGPALLPYLEGVSIEGAGDEAPFRFPVQAAVRAEGDFRGFAGTIASGRVRSGDRVRAALSSRESRVEAIVTADGELPEAGQGEAVMLTLADAIDVGRGDVLSPPDALPAVTNHFAAHLVWLDEGPLVPGNPYLMRMGHVWTPASIDDLAYRLEVDTLERRAADALAMNEIGFCQVLAGQRVALDPYGENRETGGFILVDRLTNRTCAAGMVSFPLAPSDTGPKAAGSALATAIARAPGRPGPATRRPLVLWLTGLSGAGKTTVARLLERALAGSGTANVVLDGDVLRQGLCRDLGFSEADRAENIRRAGEVARLFVEAGLVVIAAFISPFRAERAAARALVGPEAFVEIHVDTPLAECARRDPKGLYARARRGEIPNFTGIDSPYEPPDAPDLRLSTIGRTPEDTAAAVLTFLRLRGWM